VGSAIAGLDEKQRADDLDGGVSAANTQFSATLAVVVADQCATRELQLNQLLVGVTDNELERTHQCQIGHHCQVGPHGRPRRKRQTVERPAEIRSCRFSRRLYGIGLEHEAWAWR